MILNFTYHYTLHLEIPKWFNISDANFRNNLIENSEIKPFLDILIMVLEGITFILIVHVDHYSSISNFYEKLKTIYGPNTESILRSDNVKR